MAKIITELDHILAIVCLTIITALCLSKGMDGTIILAAIAGIAGIAGLKAITLPKTP